MSITKDDIIYAFVNKKYKRFDLVYEFYKDTYFNKGFTAELIAQKISAELGLEFSRMDIYNFNKRFVNKKKEIISTPIEPVKVVPVTSKKQYVAPKKDVPPVKKEEPKPASGSVLKVGNVEISIKNEQDEFKDNPNSINRVPKF